MDENWRWDVVLVGDARWNGAFVYAVKTTGIYCRPSCGARRPKRKNVTFFDSPAAAERAGYRACKRCKPAEAPASSSRATRVVQMCRMIEDSQEVPSLEALAGHVGWSPSHAHRTFKSMVGLTPRDYAAALVRERVGQGLRRQRSTVTEAIFEAGFNATSRFYERTGELLGMSVQEFRSGAAGVEIRFAVGECSLGSVLVAASAQGVCAVLLGDEPEALIEDLEGRFTEAELVGADASFEGLVARVVALVERPREGHDLPLDVRGTAFQQRVWQALLKIPAGETATYAEIARAIGAPKAARAVAQACGANALAVAIPCHRVVRKDGGWSGYRWGVERKRELLVREQQNGS